MSAHALTADATDLAPDVARAARGDAAAFGRLVDRTRQTVCAIALAIVGEPAASEDVAQDVFVAAWQGLPKLRNPSSFLPWIRQTTRFRARSFVRDRSRRSTSTAEDSIARVVDPGPTPAHRLEASERAQAIREALDALPEDAREVVTLYYREGRSTGQVASLLDLSEAAVRKRLSRARKTLRDDVAQRLADGLRATAPGSAFTAAVLTTVSTASPSAAATGGGVAAAKTGGLLAKLGGVGLALAGTVAGVAAMLWGVRQSVREATSDTERRGLYRFGAVGTAVVLLTSAGLWLAGSAEHWAVPVAIFAGMITAFGVMFFVWLPRIIGERLAEELRSDATAGARHRRRRQLSIAGFVIGVLLGTAGLVAGLVTSGLIGG